VIETHVKNKDVRLVGILNSCLICCTLLNVTVVSDEFIKMWKDVVVV
jgi:hypothetical protein